MPSGEGLCDHPGWNSYDAFLVARHMERLYDDGFIDGWTDKILADSYKKVFARDLTSAGHEFLGALENKDVLDQIKASLSLKELRHMPLRRFAGLASELTEKYFRTKLGL